MNSESYFAEEKENWLGIKYVREKYICERFKSMREKFVTENRRKMENVGIQNTNQFLDIIKQLNSLLEEMNCDHKLRVIQNKEIKRSLTFLRNLSQQNQKLFNALLENNSFIVFHKSILEHKHSSPELKHEALWNVAIASNLKLTKENSETLAIAVASLAYKLFEFQKNDQLVFLEKMLFALTNFLIDYSSIGEILKDQFTLQKFGIFLLDEHHSDHISLGLWFMRNLLKNAKVAFEESLANYSIQKSLFYILKNYENDNSLLFEALWTLTYISQIPTDIEIIKEDVIGMILQIAINKEEYVLLPTLSILGNCFTSISEETLKNVLDSSSFLSLLQNTLSSTNFLIKREALFLLSNMAAKSKESAEFVIQKEDLMCFLLDILENKDPFHYKDAFYVIYNLSFVENSFYCYILKSNVEQILKKSKSSGNEKILDDEILMMQDKLSQLFK